MRQEQTFEDVDLESVRGTAEQFKKDGYRMVQICGITGKGETELLYSFDKDTALRNLRVRVPFGSSVESITPSYWSAFVYENEIHDLFGVEFEGMEMDYKGNFFRVGQKTPWKGAEKEAERWAGGPWSRSAPSIPPFRSLSIWTWSWRTSASSGPYRRSDTSTAGWRSWSRNATTSR